MASSGSTVRSCPSIPPTRALTATSSVNWAALARSPRVTGRGPRAGPAPHGGAHRAHLQRPAGRLGPVVGTADQHGDVGATGAGQQARGAHRALSVPAHHDGGAAGGGVGVGRQVAQLDVRRAGHVPGGELAVLPDVQHRGAGRRAAHRAGLDEGDGRHSPAGGGPCAHAAGELTGEVVVADLQGLPGDLAGVLVDAPDDDQGTVGGDDPAQPGGERRTQRDRHRAGDVAGGEVGDRTDVDDLGARSRQPRHVRGAESGQGRRVPDQGRSPAVQLRQAPEVRRVAAQGGEQRLDERVLGLRTQQGVRGLLRPDRRGPLGCRRSRAERPRAVRGPHGDRVVQRAPGAAATGTAPAPAPRSARDRRGRSGPPHPPGGSHR